jgi:hypothetical protein
MWDQNSTAKDFRLSVYYNIPLQIYPAYVNQPKMLVPNEGLNKTALQPEVTTLKVHVTARRR